MPLMFMKNLKRYLRLYTARGGVTKAPFVNFSVSKIFDLAKVPVYIFLISVIFNKCHRSWASVTPVKYERDIQ